jgi:hypothetical protein
MVRMTVFMHFALLPTQDTACFAIPREAPLASSSMPPFPPMRPRIGGARDALFPWLIDDCSRQPDLSQGIVDITSGEAYGLLLHPDALRPMIVRIEGHE